MRSINILLFFLLFFVTGTLINAQTTWYTLASGDWDDTEIWTLDPAGAIPVGTTGPSDNDNIVILSGKTVVVPDGTGDYADPLRNLSLALGTVTLQGQLDLGISSGHTFNILKGNGRLLMAADNYPSITTSDADFNTKGEGEGTVVFYGDDFEVSNSYTFCSLEVDMNIGQTVTLSNDLVLNDQLNVSGGTLQINGAGTTALSLTVNGDVMIEYQGNITVGAGDAFHWLNVYGDFINAGTVTLSNSAQYSEATNGAVKLKFLGESDNVMECYNNTVLYRIFVDKGSDKTYGIALSADNSSYFSLYGPITGATTDGTDGTSGYQRAPIVIENGTLELGSNIIIDRIAENINGNTPNEFTIPESGRLWVNGATVTTYDESAYAAQPWTAPSDWQGITVFGELKISAGSLTIPEDANGIRYYDNTTTSATIKLEGGTINTTQLFQYNSNGRLNYTQSGGIFNINALPTNNWSSPAFYMPHSDQVFAMTGGSIIFSSVNSHNVTAFYVASGNGNYNVTGGSVVINTPTASPSSNDVKIYSTVPLYNLIISGNAAGQEVMVTDQYGGTSNPSSLNILNDLTIEANNTFNDGGFNVSIGRNLTVVGSYFQAGGLVFDGSQDGAIINNSGSDLILPYLYIDKDRYPTTGQFYTVSLTGSDNVKVDGTLKLIRGAFDAKDFWPMVTDSVLIEDGDLTSTGLGGIALTGTSRQIIKGKVGKDQNFGRLRLNNTGSTPQIQLASNIDVTSVEFQRNQVFDLNVYNLDVSSADYTGGSWSAIRMFRTNGEASDGGLTLPIELDGATNGTVQIFPLGTTSGYSPATIIIQNSPTDSGSMTVKYSDEYHPTVDDPSGVVDFFWRVSYSGLSTVTSADMKYTFTYYSTIPTGSSRRGMIFQNDNTWYDAGTGVANGNKLEFGYNDPLEVDYTWGRNNAFNNVRTLYSKASGNFNTTSTWTTSSTHVGSDANPAPRSYDLLVIGGDPVNGNHIVTANASNADASQVWIKGKSDTGIGVGDDAVNPPTLKIASGTSGHDIEVIKGNGRLIYENNNNYNSSYSIINGSHYELCNSSEAIIEYTSSSGSGPHIIPNNSNIPYYPNLVVSENSSGTTQTQNSMDLVVKQNMTTKSGTFLLDGNYNEYVNVGGDVIVDDGTLTYEAIGTRNMEVDGDINFTGTGIFNTSGNTENLLYLSGNIVLADGSLDFDGSGDLTVYWQGEGSSTYTTITNNAVFYRLEIDKSLGENVTFDSDFDLTGSTNGAIKALTLTSGDCILNNGSININLTTGGSDYSIPSGTKLYVTQGIVNASGNSGIKLDGSLIIDGGVANIDGTLAAGGSANSSSIAFTSSGDAYLEVSNSGTLNLGDQIRRLTTTDEGVLTFVQDGGTVEIGTVGGDLKSTRGMFEILGAGSSFTQAAGDQIVINSSNGSTTVPSLYFAPETTSFGDGAGFTIMGTDEVGIYAAVPLNDLTLAENEGCIAKILTTDLELNNLTIGATNLFDVNNKDLYVNGDFIDNASSGFDAGSGTVYFVGSGDQVLGGSQPVLFNDLVQDNSAQLTIDNPGVTIGGDLEIIESCVFATGDQSVDMYGDLINAGTTTSSTSSNGIVMNGSDVQQITGTGTFAVLSINNSSGVVIPTQSGSVTITDRLRMVSGVLDIGKNLLLLTENGSFVPVNVFSTTNMVQTNLSFTDNGIKKIFPVISSSTDFVYPLGSSDGSLTKYTPVTFTIANNGNNTGSIRVKAANEAHISIIDNTSTAYDDTQNVLQYNWTLDADGIEDFSASVLMQGVASDISVTDGNSADDYITACILADGINWNKYSTDDFTYDTEITQLTFTFGSTDDIGIDGDYTAGIAEAIPDQVASYISVTDGDYSTTTTWAVYDPDTETIGTPGVSVPAGGPRGSIIYVVDSVRFSVNFEAAYRSYVESTGVADIGTSFGHRLGNVYGTGKIRVESGSLPAGAYDDFFSASGGTLEYSGTTDYDVLSEITEVNHLRFSGTGDRRLPNTNVQLFGDLIIDGPAVDNTYDVDIYIQGDVTFISGTFDAGLTTSTVVFNGSELQYIQGANEFVTLNSSAFFNMEVNNGAGVELLSNLDVTDQLLLTKGTIYTDDDRIVTIRNSATDAIVGGSDSSYIAGPISKNILNNSSFLFPVGDSDVYGPVEINVDGFSGGYWVAEYFSMNPGNYTDRPMNPATVTSPVEYVSHNEFWKIKSPAESYNALLTFTWNEISGVNPAETGFSLVNWTTTTPSWEQLSIGSPIGDASGGSVSTSNYIIFNEWTGEGNYFTFGAQDIPAYTWEGDDLTYPTDWFTAENWSGGIVPSASSDVTITTVAGANYPEITGTASMNNLTISSGSMTVNPGAKVTINGILTTNDLLTVKNTPTSISSIILNGSVSGEATEIWSGLEGNVWWYLSNPVSKAGLVDEYVNSVSPSSCYIRVYNNSNFTYGSNVSGVPDYAFSPLDAFGFAILNTDLENSMSYSGTFNNDDNYSHTASVASKGAGVLYYQYIGNPYPSYIDFDVIYDNSTLSDPTCYVYTTINEGGDRGYATYNVLNHEKANGGSPYISPAQCFWIGMVNDDVVNVGKSARTNSPGSTIGLKSVSSSSVSKKKIRLVLSNENTYDEVLIIGDGENGSDVITGYDSRKRMNGGVAGNIFTIKENINIIINSLPSFYDGEIIPLGYKVSSSGMSDFTIKVSELLNVDDYDIYLDDLEEGTSIDLKDTKEYTFTPSVAGSNNRFQIRIASTQYIETTTGINQTITSAVSVYSSDQTVYVKVSEEWLQSSSRIIGVYNVTGQLVKEIELNDLETMFTLPDTGVYLIKVVSGAMIYTEKVLGK